jgi:hypothetical protein
MDKMLKEISTWLIGKVPGLITGENVQVGFRALDAPIRCHTILESGGMIPAFELPDCVDYLLQIATRGETYQQAREDAYAIFDAINGTAGWQIPALVSGGQDYEAQVIEALAAPQYIGQDEKGAYEMSTNFLFRMKKIDFVSYDLGTFVGPGTTSVDLGSFT